MLSQRVFHSIFALSLTKKDVFLLLAKALPKRVFFYFCSNPDQSHATKVFFLLFCAYSYQSTTKNGVFLYFALILTNVLKQSCFPLFSHILTKVLPSRVFFSIFFCPYHKQSTETNGVFLYSCLNSMLTSPKMVFSLFLPLFQQKPYQKGCFFSMFALILIKALPQRLFVFLFLPLF